MNAANATSSPSRLTDHVFAELVEELAEKLEAGEPVELDVYVGRYPGYADQLGRLLPAMQAMAALGSSCSSRGNRRPAIYISTWARRPRFAFAATSFRWKARRR